MAEYSKKKFTDQEHLDLYSPDYCFQLMVHSKKGKFYQSFCAEIGISMESFEVWEQHIPEWRNAKLLAHSTVFSFWEEVGLTYVHNPAKEWSPSVWTYVMDRLNKVILSMKEEEQDSEDVTHEKMQQAQDKLEALLRDKITRSK